LIFWGTGDHSFLPPDLKIKSAWLFESQTKSLTSYDKFDPSQRFWSRVWSWDWSQFYMHGAVGAFSGFRNVVRFDKRKKFNFETIPAFKNVLKPKNENWKAIILSGPLRNLFTSTTDKWRHI